MGFDYYRYYDANDTFVDDPNDQPATPIELDYAWGTESARSLQMGQPVIPPPVQDGGPQDWYTGTLGAYLDGFSARISACEAAANNGEIDASAGNELASQQALNTANIQLNITDIATNASDIATLQGSANTLPVNGTNTVAIAQDGTTKKIDIKTDNTVRASVSDTQAQFNVPVNLASTAKFTPAGETAGSVGDITFDDDYIWVRTSTGWKKSPLYTFDATPAVYIRITQQAYQNLVTTNTVDPNITYIIIG